MLPICSEMSLIQTIGRAARNANGTVIMYADKITDSMKRAIEETNRRRAIQDKYNREHGITPKTIIKEVRDVIDMSSKEDISKAQSKKLSPKQKEELREKLTKEMRKAASELDFERAAFLRDSIAKIK